MSPHPAIAFLVSQQYETGAAFCEQAIAATGEQAENYWYLGLFRLLQGDATEAQAVWFAALTAIAPDTLETETQNLLTILLSEAERQLSLGQAHLAERIYQQVLELDATPATVYLHLGRAASLQGKLDDAIAYWQTATQLQPDFSAAYEQLATVFHKLEQWDDAIAAYQQALERHPSVENRYHLALCLGQQQQWSAALEQLNQVLDLQPNFAAAYGDRGWAKLQQNQWSDATTDFIAALQTYSTYAQTYTHWVEQLQQQKLPCSETLRFNATQLNKLCESAGEAWQQWSADLQPISPSTFTPTSNTISPPANYWLDTQQWAAAHADAEFVSLDVPTVMALKPPKTRDRTIHFSFRLEPEIPLPETFVVTLPQGRFWLSADESSSAIITANNELLGELSPEFPLLSPGHPAKHPSHHSIWQRSLPPIQSVDGVVAVLAGLTNDLYFHWIFDVLPRFDLLTRSNIEIDSIDYFLVSSHRPFQQETLQRLGIPASKILETQNYLHLQADRLVVPSYPSSPAWMTQRVCRWLQQIILGANFRPQAGCDRVYLTRQHATTRRIINEMELIKFLQPLGFQVVALETLTVQAQAQLLASAQVVISAHGGGLTNLTFCQPGTKVIEIFSPNFVYPCYWLVSNLLQLDYYYLTGRLPTGWFLHTLLYPNPRVEDIFIELSDLSHILQMADVR